MFSRVELEFLKGNVTVKPAYERVLLHRILKKTKNLSSTLRLLAQNEKTKHFVEELFSVTGNSNSITDFSNSKEAQNESLSTELRWGCPDLNRSHESPSLVA